MPLGVLVAGLLGWLFYREFNKKHHGNGAMPVATTEHYSPMAQQQVPSYTSGYAQNGGYGHGGQQAQQYESHTPKTNIYSPSAPGYVEAPTANGVHEMGTR